MGADEFEAELRRKGIDFTSRGATPISAIACGSSTKWSATNIVAKALPIAWH